MILRERSSETVAVVDPDSLSESKTEGDMEEEDTKPSLSSKGREKCPAFSTQRPRSSSMVPSPAFKHDRDNDTHDSTEHDLEDEDAKPRASSKARGKRPVTAIKRCPSSLAPPLLLKPHAPSSSSFLSTKEEDVKACVISKAGSLSSVLQLTPQGPSSRKRARESCSQPRRKRGRPATNRKPEVIEISDSEEDDIIEVPPPLQPMRSVVHVPGTEIDIPSPLVVPFMKLSDARRMVSLSWAVHCRSIDVCLRHCSDMAHGRVQKPSLMC